jgi:hypothetical protein
MEWRPCFIIFLKTPPLSRFADKNPDPMRRKSPKKYPDYVYGSGNEIRSRALAGVNKGVIP